jgi:hypothetical protein
MFASFKKLSLKFRWPGKVSGTVKHTERELTEDEAKGLNEAMNEYFRVLDRAFHGLADEMRKIKP